MMLPTDSKSISLIPWGSICQAPLLPHNSITNPSLKKSPQIGGRGGFFDLGDPDGGPLGGPDGGPLGGFDGGPEGGPLGGFEGGPDGGPEGGPPGGFDGGPDGRLSLAASNCDVVSGGVEGGNDGGVEAGTSVGGAVGCAGGSGGGVFATPGCDSCCEVSSPRDFENESKSPAG